MECVLPCIEGIHSLFCCYSPQSQSKVSISMASEELKKTSTCLGADLLMKLLGNYCRKKDIKTAITVGVVGGCSLKFKWQS